MAAAPASRLGNPVQVIQLLMLGSAATLFLGGLLSDIAYARSYEIQWTNFAAWLIAGAMVFTGVALAGSLIEAVLPRVRRRAALLLLVMVLVIFVLGLVNSFIHTRDAWGSMPSGLVLSILVTLLALATTGFRLASLRTGAEA